MPDLAAPYIQRGIVEILLLAVLAGVLGTWVVLRRLPFFTLCGVAIVGFPLVSAPMYRHTMRTLGVTAGAYLRALWPGLSGTLAMSLAVVGARIVDAPLPLAARFGVEGKGLEELAAEAQIVAAVQEAIDKGNAELSRVEQIKKFTIVPGDWEPGGDELTPTMKLKRKPISEKYADEIEAMYAK